MASTVLNISLKTDLPQTPITLPASKSIANRALLINALAGNTGNLHNLSEARDTQTMQRLLTETGDTWDVLDAGTTMRFLTAYAAVSNTTKTLTGTDRMKERPIKILVEALQTLGASITYLEAAGFPPIRVSGLDNPTHALTIRGDISSQYVSALLMIAPSLPQGLSLHLTGKISSRPYISMTLAVMKAFGVSGVWENNIIRIAPQSYQPTDYTIEPDWSAASYWYSFVALSKVGTILLKDLREKSIQGDHAIADYMLALGVKTTYTADGALLEKAPHQKTVQLDFADCPDMAQTVAVLCAAKGIHCKMTGLESLRIKETDRIAALQKELSKIGAELVEKDALWEIIPSSQPLDEFNPTFDTYHDHRMAMAFAPLATLMNITINDPEVVEKSYPRFWEDMEQTGFLLDK